MTENSLPGSYSDIDLGFLPYSALGPRRRTWSHRRADVAKLNPVILFTAYLFTLMFIPSDLIFAPLGAAGTPALVLSLLIFLWYVASWSVGVIVPSRAGRPIRVAIFVFSATILISFVAAMTRNITDTEVLGADRGLIIIGAWSGLVIAISQTLNSYDQLETLMRRAVIFGSIVAAIGAFEFYSGINVIKYLQIPGLSVNGAVSTATLYRNGLIRPSSTASQPIEFSVVMAMLLPFAMHQAFDSARKGLVRKWLPVLLIGFAIPMSVSRSGILAAVIALAFLVSTWHRHRQRYFLVGAVLSLVPLHFLAPGLIGTLDNYFGGLLGSSGNTSVATRTSDYSRDWPYIQQRPIFGRGFETFIPQTYGYTDNTYLHQLVECGIIGLAALVFLFLLAMQCAAAGRRRAREEPHRAFGQATVASIAAAAVASATFDSLDFPMFAGLLFLTLGIAGAYSGIMTIMNDATSPMTQTVKP